MRGDDRLAAGCFQLRERGGSDCERILRCSCFGGWRTGPWGLRRRTSTRCTRRRLLAVVEQAHARRLLSQEHFTVRRRLDPDRGEGLGEPARLPAWSRTRRTRAPERAAGSCRATRTGRPPAPRRGCPARVSSGASAPGCRGHVITENRNGLVVQAMSKRSSTTAEREAALAMPDRLRRAGGGDRAGRRQGLPERALRRATANSQGDSARGRAQAQPQMAQLADRSRAQPSRLRDQAAEAQAGREGLRPGQARSAAPAGQAARPALNWLPQLVATAHAASRPLP